MADCMHGLAAPGCDVCLWVDQAQGHSPHHGQSQPHVGSAAAAAAAAAISAEDMAPGDAEELAKLLVNLSSETEDVREHEMARHAHELLREVAPQPAKGAEQARAGGVCPTPPGLDMAESFPGSVHSHGVQAMPSARDQRLQTSAASSPKHADACVQDSLQNLLYNRSFPASSLQRPSLHDMAAGPSSLAPVQQSRSFQTSMLNMYPADTSPRSAQTSFIKTPPPCVPPYSPPDNHQALQTSFQYGLDVGAQTAQSPLYEQSHRMLTPAAQEEPAPRECGHAARVAKRKADAREAVINAILAKTNRLLSDDNQRQEETQREMERGFDEIRRERERAEAAARAAQDMQNAQLNAQLAALANSPKRDEGPSPAMLELLNEVRKERTIAERAAEQAAEHRQLTEGVKEQLGALLAKLDKDNFERQTLDRFQREANDNAARHEDRIRLILERLQPQDTTKQTDDMKQLVLMLFQHIKELNAKKEPPPIQPVVVTAQPRSPIKREKAPDPWSVAPIGPSGQTVHCIPQRTDAKSPAADPPGPRETSPPRIRSVPVEVPLVGVPFPIPPPMPVYPIHPAEVAASAAAHAAVQREIIRAHSPGLLDVPVSPPPVVLDAQPHPVHVAPAPVAEPIRSPTPLKPTYALARPAPPPADTVRASSPVPRPQVVRSPSPAGVQYLSMAPQAPPVQAQAPQVVRVAHEPTPSPPRAGSPLRHQDTSPQRKVDVIRCPVSPHLLNTITRHPHQATIPATYTISPAELQRLQQHSPGH